MKGREGEGRGGEGKMKRRERGGEENRENEGEGRGGEGRGEKTTANEASNGYYHMFGNNRSPSLH